MPQQAAAVVAVPSMQVSTVADGKLKLSDSSIRAHAGHNMTALIAIQKIADEFNKRFQDDKYIVSSACAEPRAKKIRIEDRSFKVPCVRTTVTAKSTR